MKMFWKLSLVFVVTLLIKGCDSQPVACGRAPLNTKIVGGVNASAGAWPWQVSLHAHGSHFCGGSLINNQWVLSAAHCFPGTNASSITVYLGRQSQEQPNPNEVTRSVSQIIVHPSYGDGQSENNDMALLRLSSSVNFTDYIGPVCLSAEGSTFNSDTMWVTGWGTIDSGVSLPSPQILQEVDVPLVGNSKCNCLYNGQITDNMMCAGLSEGGKDSCQGDSGGPMVIKQGSTWIQAGVVSFGYGCALPQYPGVYARVSQYQQWISNQISPSRAGFVTFNSTTPLPDENCIWPTSRPTLCGGSAGAWPWVARLSYQGYPMCVGTLVSDQFVMTSANCFSGLAGRDGWTVTLDVVQWDCSSISMSAGVANVFFDDIYGNGVALVELTNPFYYVANLPVDMYDLSFGPGTQCSVVGWNSGWQPSLQEVQTTIVNCDPSETSPINICTEQMSSLQVQNGIPLLCRMNDMWIQTGFLSLPPGSGINPQSSNSTVFIKTSPFAIFLTNTIRDYPTILNGAKSFSPLSFTCILLFSFPAVLQAIY